MRNKRVQENSTLCVGDLIQVGVNVERVTQVNNTNKGCWYLCDNHMVEHHSIDWIIR